MTRGSRKFANEFIIVIDQQLNGSSFTDYNAADGKLFTNVAESPYSNNMAQSSSIIVSRGISKSACELLLENSRIPSIRSSFDGQPSLGRSCTIPVCKKIFNAFYVGGFRE